MDVLMPDDTFLFSDCTNYRNRCFYLCCSIFNHPVDRCVCYRSVHPSLHSSYNYNDLKPFTDRDLYGNDEFERIVLRIQEVDP